LLNSRQKNLQFPIEVMRTMQGMRPLIKPTVKS
jgi:hypothetical protein